jgi:hypothetical protein
VENYSDHQPKLSEAGCKYFYLAKTIHAPVEFTRRSPIFRDEYFAE